MQLFSFSGLFRISLMSKIVLDDTLDPGVNILEDVASSAQAINMTEMSKQIAIAIVIALYGDFEVDVLATNKKGEVFINIRLPAMGSTKCYLCCCPVLQFITSHYTFS